MIISVVNHTKDKLPDQEVQKAIRAINRQIREDFQPYWGYGATLRLEGKVGTNPDQQSLAEMRGDAVLYLWDKNDVPNALGYHDQNSKGIPYGFVFIEFDGHLSENWTVTFSHEALELVADPEANLLVAGPDPRNKLKTVFHWYEVCDAVQNETYEVDGITVSNFLLPLYFTTRDEEGSRNDFLGTRSSSGKTLASFGVNPGGYIGYFDPATGKNEQFYEKGDIIAQQKIQSKQVYQKARRGLRYVAHTEVGSSDHVRSQGLMKTAKVLFIHGMNTRETQEYQKDQLKIAEILNAKLSTNSQKVEVDYLNYNSCFGDPAFTIDVGKFLHLLLEKGLLASFGLLNMAEALAAQAGEAIETTLENIYNSIVQTLFGGIRAATIGEPIDDTRFFGLYNVCQFLYYPQVRDSFSDFLKGRQYNLIIGHSFGTLLSYDSLLSDSLIGSGSSYLTIGSQISQGVFDTIYGSASDDRNYPTQIKQWLNLFNQQDLVYVKNVSVQDQKFTTRTINSPGTRLADEHSHLGYLKELFSTELEQLL